MFPAKFQAYSFKILGEKQHLCLAQFPETVKMLIKIWKLEENRSKPAGEHWYVCFASKQANNQPTNQPNKQTNKQTTKS